MGRPHPLEAIELVPSGGGVFEVWADGDLIFSKKQSGRHPSADEVASALRSRLA